MYAKEKLVVSSKMEACTTICRMDFGTYGKRVNSHQHPSTISPHFTIFKKMNNSFAEFLMVEVYRDPLLQSSLNKAIK
jgi:hypothetical protein